jgi:orotate phosphoribosyltransferase
LRVRDGYCAHRRRSGDKNVAIMIGDDLFQQHRDRLLILLTRLSYEQREVTLASGMKSNFYIDCKQAVLTAEGHFLVGALFNRILSEQVRDVEAIGGLTMGADPLASAVATVSFIAGRPLTAFYVRKEPKGHGTGQWLEGTKSLRPGMPVAILEDVVTTGGSALKAIARVREAGLKVSVILGLVDREEGGREALEREAPLITLFRRRDFP